MADNKPKQKVACVDFDNTICASDYPALGPIKPGAKEALQLLRKLGYYIIISSCRSCGWNWSEYYPDVEFVHASSRPVHIAMVDYINEHELEYDEIDDGTKGKVSADFYIDDKGIRYENNWDEVMARIINMEENGSII